MEPENELKVYIRLSESDVKQALVWLTNGYVGFDGRSDNYIIYTSDGGKMALECKECGAFTRYADKEYPIHMPGCETGMKSKAFRRITEELTIGLRSIYGGGQ